MAATRPAVLLLCEDPVASHLLRSLLRAVPAPHPEVLAPESLDEAQRLAPRCGVCLLEPGYAGLATPLTLARLRAAAPNLRMYGVLGEVSRHGDRADLLQAMRGGLLDALLLEELSVARLVTLLRASATDIPALIGAPLSAPAAASPPASGAGYWRIQLAEQQAAFDAATLAALGQPAAGTGIGDWKALIHPDDVDDLVSAVQRVLEGGDAAAPAYRLRRADGGWLPVSPGDILIERAADQTPRAIEGRFRIGAEAPAPLRDAPATVVAGSSPPPATEPGAQLAMQCHTALAHFRRQPDGSFRLHWCNAAAAAGRDAAMLAGQAPAALVPPCDGFQPDAALARVADTGIAESHDLLSLERVEPPRWLRLHLSRLRDAEVLLEITDVSELINARQARRTADELAQHVVRSLPFTTLVVDEAGRVLHCLATAGGPLGDDAGAIEDHSLNELLGPEAARACLEQVIRTLNTGRPAVATLAHDGNAGPGWIECHTTLLRARPGMPPRVVLGLLDASARTATALELRAAAAQLRAALGSVPLPLYLKDADGRYSALNPAFEQLMGVEAAMLAGKTDFEVFPDEVAAELHAGERRALAEGGLRAVLLDAGVGAARAPHWCFEFPVHGPDGDTLGCGGVWIPLQVLPASMPARGTAALRDIQPGDLDHATASVVNRVEDALTDSGDYAGVLRQLEQLVETTMQAQAIMHNVAGQPAPPPSRPLVALAPLAQEIVDLERILVPPTARFENHIDTELPPAHCEPVAFHQILLRAIRHARRSLGAEGTLCIRLRSSTGGGRGCISCHGGFDGHYVELVIEDSDSCLAEGDIDYLTDTAGEARALGSALDDLAEIHALAHAQGGHLQIQRNVPAGTSLHVFFRAGDPAAISDLQGRARSTVAQFPRGRNGGRS